MADRAIKPKRGTEAENDAYVGEEGELTVDTDNNQVRVHDGATSGGHANGAGHNLRVDPDTNQTLTANSETTPVFGGATFDEGGQWDASNNKFVAATDGKYRVEFKTVVSGNADGGYQARIKVNGSYSETAHGYLHGTDSTVTSSSVRASILLDLNAGDEVTFTVDNNISSDITFRAGSLDSFIAVEDR